MTDLTITNLVGARAVVEVELKEAEKLAAEKRRQSTILYVGIFLEENPDVEAVNLSGSWESDDEGGSDFWIYSSFEMSDDSEEDGWRLEEKFRDGIPQGVATMEIFAEPDQWGNYQSAKLTREKINELVAGVLEAL